MKEYYDRVPCDDSIPCKYRDTTGCFEDLHHEAYPKSEYRTKLEKKFREHAMNKVIICRRMHNDIHAQNLPPQKPDAKTMIKLMEAPHEGTFRQGGG